MPYNDYDCLKATVSGGIATVVIDNPPINLFDIPLMMERDRIGREIEVDDSIRVVVFRSANPDFFIAHADVPVIQQMPTDVFLRVPPSSASSTPWSTAFAQCRKGHHRRHRRSRSRRGQ